MVRSTTFTLSLDKAALSMYVATLLNTHFPDQDPIDPSAIGIHLDQALLRLEKCMTGIQRKYFNEAGNVRFEHLNSDHMATFIYLLSNTIWNETGDARVPTKLFYLNKVMNSLDLYFSVALPEVFFLVHPVGTVIGNAEYGNYFAIYQGCSVGAVDGSYPRFGEGTILYAGSTVLGKTISGDNVVFAARSFVINTDIPSNSVVTGSFPGHTVTSSHRSVKHRIFGLEGTQTGGFSI